MYFSYSFSWDDSFFVDIHFQRNKDIYDVYKFSIQRYLFIEIIKREFKLISSIKVHEFLDRKQLLYTDS